MRFTGFLCVSIALVLPAALRADVNLVVDASDPFQLSANAGDTKLAQNNFTLTNTGTTSTAFTFSFQIQNGGNWLSASTGQAPMTLDPGQSLPIIVFADPSGLEANSNPGYLAVLTISGEGSSVQVNVEFQVSGVIITVAPNQISVTLLSGQSMHLLPANQQGSHVDGGANVLVTPSGGTWLAVPGFDSVNGNPAPLDIGFDLDATGLSPGDYMGTIVVSCIGGAPCLSKAISVTLTVTLPLGFTTKSLPNGVVGSPYSQTLQVNGVPPYTWALLGGALPQGLRYSSTTGEITGTPTQVGTSNFTLLVVDSASEQATMGFSLTIGPSASALVRAGALSQVASGGGWKSSIYLINTSSLAVAVQVNLWADSGGALVLPLTTTVGGASLTSTAAIVSETIGPNSTLLIESDAQTSSGSTGWAEILSTAPVAGYGVFHYTSVSGIQSEGTVPLEQTFQPSFDLPFDNVSQFGTGVALANLSSTETASISATVRDAAGNQIATQSISLNPNGHQSLTLAALLPATAGNRGIVQFRSMGGGITGLGLRVNPLSSFTSVPKLALPAGGSGQVLTRVGVLSQVAFGGGWNSSIYLINNSLSALSVTVRFWADGGTPLLVPLIETQAAASQLINASTVSATIAPEATLLLVANAQAPAESSGWADVLSNGPVAGYGVFHYTSPEGVQSEGTVPLETDFDSSFILPYDNVNLFQTGVAVANLVATQPAAVAGTIWDANGSQVGTTVLDPLPSSGHRSFQLSTSFPAALGNRGIVQFTTPAGGSLTGLGLRVNPTGGFTSVPKLPRH